MDHLSQLISLALLEDSGFGDLTAESIFAPGLKAKGIIVAKEPMIIAGLDVASKVFKTVDPDAVVDACFDEGDSVSEGDIVIKVNGDVIRMLKAERVALNFVQRLSGIASLARLFVKTLGKSRACLTDTRKTTPGMRRIEKAAVRAGGAFNHRMSLYDGVIIKDNHIAAAGGIKNAVKAVRTRISHLMKIEVETTNMEEVKEALEAGAEVIMLDNMGIDEMKQAVSYINGRAIVEASGNVTLENLKEIAATGVDIISSGAITHQAKAMDLSMRISNSTLYFKKNQRNTG